MQEIKQNHDALSLYMVKAMSELYTRGCMDEKAILHLSGQLNNVYVEQVELKKKLAAFVSKLNDKIVSVDNYNMLLKEIEQNKYKDVNSIITILRILAQLDDYCFNDERKIEILRNHLIQNEYMNSEMISFVSCLERIMELDYEIACQIYFEFGSIRSNFVCDLLMEMIETYHFLPEMQKQLIDKRNLLDTFVSAHNLNQSSSISSETLFDDYISEEIKRVDYLREQDKTDQELEREKLQNEKEEFIRKTREEQEKLQNEQERINKKAEEVEVKKAELNQDLKKQSKKELIRKEIINTAPSICSMGEFGDKLTEDIKNKIVKSVSNGYLSSEEIIYIMHHLKCFRVHF